MNEKEALLARLRVIEDRLRSLSKDPSQAKQDHPEQRVQRERVEKCR